METVRFEEMGLSEEIQKAVRYMGFEEASPIQAKAIPAMISGIDLIGQAQTGTGKTAAFGIPILEKVDPKLKKRRRSFSARPESLQSRWQTRSATCPDICMESRFCRFTEDRIS